MTDGKLEHADKNLTLVDGSVKGYEVDYELKSHGQHHRAREADRIDFRGAVAFPALRRLFQGSQQG